jgi:hypothetical protein
VWKSSESQQQHMVISPRYQQNQETVQVLSDDDDDDANHSYFRAGIRRQHSTVSSDALADETDQVAASTGSVSVNSNHFANPAMHGSNQGETVYSGQGTGQPMSAVDMLRQAFGGGSNPMSGQLALLQRMGFLGPASPATSNTDMSYDYSSIPSPEAESPMHGRGSASNAGGTRVSENNSDRAAIEVIDDDDENTDTEVSGNASQNHDDNLVQDNNSSTSNVPNDATSADNADDGDDDASQHSELDQEIVQEILTDMMMKYRRGRLLMQHGRFEQALDLMYAVWMQVSPAEFEGPYAPSMDGRLLPPGGLQESNFHCQLAADIAQCMLGTQQRHFEALALLEFAHGLASKIPGVAMFTNKCIRLIAAAHEQMSQLGIDSSTGDPVLSDSNSSNNANTDSGVTTAAASTDTSGTCDPDQQKNESNAAPIPVEWQSFAPQPRVDVLSAESIADTGAADPKASKVRKIVFVKLLDHVYTENSPKDSQRAFKLIRRVLRAIIEQPQNLIVRQLPLSENYMRVIGRLQGASQLLQRIGFTSVSTLHGMPVLALPCSADMQSIQDMLQVVDIACTISNNDPTGWACHKARWLPLQLIKRFGHQ